MNIQFFEKKGQKLISCNFVIPIGTNQTWKDKGSFAHLVEHLIFKGHPKLTQYELMQQIEGIGGIINASTDSMHTEIFARVEERYLVEVVKLVYEAIVAFDISSEDIEEETEIIEIEESQIYEDEEILNTVLGLNETKLISKFNEEELREIYHTNYDINNWTLILVGEVKEQTKREIERYATSKKDKIFENIGVQIPDSAKYEAVIVGDEAYFTYYHPCRELCDKVNMKIIKYLLTSGMSSYFYKTLVDENAYTYQISFRDVYYDRVGFVIFLACEEKNMDMIRKAFEHVFATPDFIVTLTDKEIRRAINMTITEYYLKSESVSSWVRDRIDSLLMCRSFIDYDEIINSLSKKSEKEIKAQIKSLLFA